MWRTKLKTKINLEDLVENELLSSCVKMVFDIRSPDSLFIELNGKTFRIDDSTNEGICEVVK